MMWSKLSSWNQGITSFCTLILTAPLLYYAIPRLQYWTRKPTKRAKKSILRRQMTPIGKFALLSQTERNPSIISFFVALASKDKGMSINQFKQLWMKIMEKHERFRFHVSEDGTCFEDGDKSVDDYVVELPHPRNPDEFKARVNQFLTSHIDVTDQPWEVSLSSGPIGASGAILNSNELLQQGYKSETVALFRVHHVLCDGVSMSTVVKDISDEKDRLDDLMIDAVDKAVGKYKKVGVLKRLVGFVMHYFFGSVYALSLQLYNMATSSNPFDEFTKHSEDTENGRSVSWGVLSTVDDAKYVAKSIGKHTKLNDLFVALLSKALERQYQDLKAKSDTSTQPSKCPSYVNVVVTAHLTGSILPGQSLGNNIGAFCISVPFNASSPSKPVSSLSRLRIISKTLNKIKRTPVTLISWFITYVISKLGVESIAKDAIIRANCHAVAVISNVHGFPFQIHWKGMPIKNLCAFLPLPPKVPVGLLVTSYDGKIILSVESADEQVVPDAERFLHFMLDEYEAIKNEVSRGEVMGS